MKKLSLVFAFFVSVAAAVAVQAANFQERTLAALLDSIAEVESGSDPSKIGPVGERGEFQFTQGTWRDRTSAEFTRAHDRQFGRQIAEEHLRWLIERLRKSGTPVTTWNLAHCWNAGAKATIQGKIVPRTRNYADRVDALVKDRLGLPRN